jgi:hypothetical protein
VRTLIRDFTSTHDRSIGTASSYNPVEYMQLLSEAMSLFCAVLQVELRSDRPSSFDVEPGCECEDDWDNDPHDYSCDAVLAQNFGVFLGSVRGGGWGDWCGW